MPKSKKFILWFNEISIKDVPAVGGKNASLGEMYRHLVKKGLNIDIENYRWRPSQEMLDRLALPDKYIFEVY